MFSRVTVPPRSSFSLSLPARKRWHLNMTCSASSSSRQHGHVASLSSLKDTGTRENIRDLITVDKSNGQHLHVFAQPTPQRPVLGDKSISPFQRNPIVLAISQGSWLSLDLSEIVDCHYHFPVSCGTFWFSHQLTGQSVSYRLLRTRHRMTRYGMPLPFARLLFYILMSHYAPTQ